MPQLSVWQTNKIKKQQRLENIDSYMLLETTQLLQRVEKFCLSIVMPDSTIFEIKLVDTARQARLQISGQFEQKKLLDEMVNNDHWISGAFSWLHANYCALAYSQEMLTFSYAYERNRQLALHEYKHFEQLNQGMDCYLSCQVEQGIPHIEWRIESPVMAYHIEG